MSLRLKVQRDIFSRRRAIAQRANWLWHSVLLCDEGRFDESFRQIDLVHDRIAWSLWFDGHSEEAIEEWRKMAELEVEAFCRGGRKAYAELRLKACTERFADTHRNDFIAAEWNTYVESKDEALAILEQEVARRSQRFP
jgi:hypothetical protein